MQTRRRLLRNIIATGTAPLILPRHLIAGSGQTPPSEKLTTAHIGVSGMGGGNLGEIGKFAEVQVVGLCDVDTGHLAGAAKEYPNAKTHRDWRKMLESQKDIDAVVVSTPDHHHAPVSLAAMVQGKHVYCEKPLAHTIEEARLMYETSEKMKVVTQMGNGGHGGDGLRRWQEYIDAGAIGKVKEIHSWSDRAGNRWSQGKPRPKDTPAVPNSLDWDLWLGPAPERPYHPSYHPFHWRGIWDFGCGALGDMAVHNADPAYWVLGLGAPDWVDAEVSDDANDESFPTWSIVKWHFAATNKHPELIMKWYDGGKKPENVPFLDPKVNYGDNGLIIVGEKGALVGGSHAGPPRLWPVEASVKTPPPKPTLPRSAGHRIEWVRAALAGKPRDSLSGFWYSAPFTESLLTGLLAVRFKKRIEWDAAKMEAKNCPEAQAVIRKAYREGWKLPV